VISQGEIWWADLPAPTGSGPGFRRPVVVVQSDALNQSRISTAICVPLTSNLKWALAPGNVCLAFGQLSDWTQLARVLPSSFSPCGRINRPAAEVTNPATRFDREITFLKFAHLGALLYICCTTKFKSCRKPDEH
jgi:PemK-like, MazF-like toxin of type II toxin-antitoxin system